MSFKPPSYKEVSPAAGISIAAQQIKSVRETSEIRSQRPEFDAEKCTKCKLCMTFCPEGCIYEDDDGTIRPSLTFCKGCGICAYECPVKAIEMVIEEG